MSGAAEIGVAPAELMSGSRKPERHAGVMAEPCFAWTAGTRASLHACIEPRVGKAGTTIDV